MELLQKQIHEKGAVFKWVQHTPMGHLKRLNEKDLSEVRQQLIREVRDVARALQWIDGIIDLQKLDKEKEVTLCTQKKL